MTELYLPIKHAHWLFIAISIFLFNLRFFLRVAKPEQPLPLVWRILPHANDTLLLFTGMMMMTIAKWSPFGSAKWLGLKLFLVVTYVLVGAVCMRSQPRSAKAWLTYVGAMAIVGVIAWLAHCKFHDMCQFFAGWA